MEKYSIMAILSSAVLVGCQDNTFHTISIEEDISLEQIVITQTTTYLNGIYRGEGPCGDCAGTKLLLEIKSDEKYFLSRSYVDKMSTTVVEEGAVIWNENDNTIQIDQYRFLISDNKLFLVDPSGEHLKDDEGLPYILNKETEL